MLLWLARTPAQAVVAALTVITDVRTASAARHQAHSECTCLNCRCDVGGKDVRRRRCRNCNGACFQSSLGTSTGAQVGTTMAARTQQRRRHSPTSARAAAGGATAAAPLAPSRTSTWARTAPPPSSRCVAGLSWCRGLGAWHHRACRITSSVCRHQSGAVLRLFSGYAVLPSLFSAEALVLAWRPLSELLDSVDGTR